MFDAIGKKGHTHPLSARRWLLSSGVGGVLIVLLMAVTQVLLLLSPKSMDADTLEEEIEVSYVEHRPRESPPTPRGPETNAKSEQKISRQVEQKPPPDPPEPAEQPANLEDEPEAAAEPGPGAESDSSSTTTAPGSISDSGYANGPIGSVGDGTSSIQEINYQAISCPFRPKPSYPALARRNGIEDSDIIVDITFAPDGSVIEVRWIQGNEIFRDSIAAAVSAWKCDPSGTYQRVRQPFSMRLRR